MENQVQVFEFQQNQVRVVMRGREPWFVARDVCDVLDVSNTGDALARLEEDERDTIGLTDGIPGNPNKAIVSEAGLYALVLGSRKPEAKAFKRWVTHDVLPSIRKNGMYATNALLDDPEHLLAVTQRLVEERRARQAAEKQLTEQKPMVEFAETCLSSKDSILVRELAKVACDEGLPIGEKRLYQRLREWGLILPSRTEPSQKAMDAGYFEVIQRPVDTPFGERLTRTTKVTPKGQIHIIDKLRKVMGRS